MPTRKTLPLLFVGRRIRSEGAAKYDHDAAAARARPRADDGPARGNRGDRGDRGDRGGRGRIQASDGLNPDNTGEYDFSGLPLLPLAEKNNKHTSHPYAKKKRAVQFIKNTRAGVGDFLAFVRRSGATCAPAPWVCDASYVRRTPGAPAKRSRAGRHRSSSRPVRKNDHVDDALQCYGHQHSRVFSNASRCSRCRYQIHVTVIEESALAALRKRIEDEGTHTNCTIKRRWVAFSISSNPPAAAEGPHVALGNGNGTAGE